MSVSSSKFPPCPHLPHIPAAAPMDWRSLHELGDERGAMFYERCLCYAHYLWKQGLAARALLALDRALLAGLRGDEPVLREHPLPYLPVAWLIAHTPEAVFLGNPRVHYQHLADRVREPRRAQRSARAWACWHLVRAVRPGLPGDARHVVREPTMQETASSLDEYGIAGERGCWTTAMTWASRPGP